MRICFDCCSQSTNQMFIQALGVCPHALAALCTCTNPRVGCCQRRRWRLASPALQALTKWGGALLELAHFRQGAEAYEMIEEAIGKFEQALALDAARHDALWCLGNAFTSQGFLSAEAASGERLGGASALVGLGRQYAALGWRQSMGS